MPEPTTTIAQVGAIPREIERLLLETHWRISHKINNSPAFAPWKLAYLLVEELALLFEVLVVRISVNENLSPDDVFREHFPSEELNISPDDYLQ